MTALSPRISTAADFRLGDFRTAGGALLRQAVLRYRVFGDPARARERGWSLVFHALTGSHQVDQWWGPLLEPGQPLDPARGPVLAANLLGSCYGSSGPRGGAAEWPELSTEDLARAHIPLLESLGIERLALATGGSLGGMVALQWARVSPIPTDRVVVFAAPARTSAQSIAWNAAQRMAIEANPTTGLAAARAIAMITYRSAVEFAQRFGRERNGQPDHFAVESYLRRQGDKLVARFDATSYLSLMRSMDLHDVGDLATAGRETATRVGQVVGVGIDTDILYDRGEVRAWVDAYRLAGARTAYREIRTVYGHDAFLIEWDQVAEILRG